MTWYYSTPQPHHRYEFHTAILLANKKIYVEAAYILYNENLFVLVSINDEHFSSYTGVLSRYIEQCGVPILARKCQARALQHHAMKLYIGADLEKYSVIRTEFIIAGDDLSLLCKSYVKFCPCSSQIEYDCYLQRSFIRLELLEGKSERPFANQRAVHKPATYERILLEPFRQLHSQASVHIAGAISAEYKSEIMSEMMKAPQNADDLLHLVTIAQKQAEEHFDHGNLDLACKTYQTVIEDVELGYDWPPQPGRPSRCYAGRRGACDKAICFAELSIRNRLSEICLALEKPIEALKWVNSAILMLYDHRDYTNANGTWILQAKLRYQFAWASHQMDVRCRALDNIELALKMDPENNLYKRIQREWLEEEAQQPHKHGGNYPEACKGSLSWDLARSNKYGNPSSHESLSWH